MNKTSTKQKVFKIETEYPDIKSNIKVLKYVLLPLEFWCLERIFLLQRPASTGEYYNQKLIETAKTHLRDLMNKFKAESRSGVISKESSERQRAYATEALTLNRMLNDISASTLRTFEEKLRSKGVKFPSYATILKTLERLEGWGLVDRREEGEDSKVNFYWHVNTNFYLRYGKLVEEQLLK